MKTIEHESVNSAGEVSLAGGDGGRQIVPQDLSNLSDADKLISSAIAGMVYGALGWVFPTNDVHESIGGQMVAKTASNIVALNLRQAGTYNNNDGSVKTPRYIAVAGSGCVLWNWRLFTFKGWVGSSGEPKWLVLRKEAISPSPLYDLNMEKNSRVHYELTCTQMTDEEKSAAGEVLFALDLTKRRPLWVPEFKKEAQFTISTIIPN